MSYEAIVDDGRLKNDDGHPTITAAYREPLAQVSLEIRRVSESVHHHFTTCIILE